MNINKFLHWKSKIWFTKAIKCSYLILSNVNVVWSTNITMYDEYIKATFYLIIKMGQKIALIL